MRHEVTLIHRVFFPLLKEDSCGCTKVSGSQTFLTSGSLDLHNSHKMIIWVRGWEKWGAEPGLGSTSADSMMPLAGLGGAPGCCGTSKGTTDTSGK